MKTLVIDTTGITNRIAVFDAGKIVTEFESNSKEKRSESETLLKSTQVVFQQAGLEPTELDLIITVLGPGSYTGSRSGLSFAKALSQATNVPLTGASILDVIFFSSGKSQTTFPTRVTLSAGADRVYTKVFNSVEDTFTTRDEGEVLENTELGSEEILNATELPSLEEINEYTIQYFQKNGPDNFLNLLPLYLKEPNITQPKKH